MNKKAKIPTIIGIIILVLSLAAGVIFVQNRQLFRLGAEGQNSPKDVRISNITASSFSVTWITDTQTTGFVKYGDSVGSMTNTKTEESEISGYTHLVNLTGLSPQTNYFFKINSGGSDFDNNGVTWQGQTVITQDTNQPTLISGNVLLATGGAKNSIVYITTGTKLYSTLTSQNGSWIISLPANIYSANNLLEISALNGQGEVSTSQIYSKSAIPVPTMIFGQTHDFKNLPPSESTDTPKASLGVPETGTPSSGFDVSGQTSTPSASTVTLDSISSGEVVTSVKPEFFGEGPKGTEIQITVESEDPVTDKVTIPASGKWNWEIPKDLPEGPHTITITWKDGGGILRTLTRNFVVQASEGPAFVSTPSATPKTTMTPTPTATSSATPKATATPSATLKASPTGTPFPQPVSGDLTPTLLLSIMGIGALIFSFKFLVFN